MDGWMDGINGKKVHAGRGERHSPFSHDYFIFCIWMNVYL